MVRVIQATLTRFAAGRAPNDGDSHLIHDLLWAHAMPAEGLEHIRVRPVEHGLDVFLFVRAPCDATALLRVRGLITRVRNPMAVHGLKIESL